MSRSTPHWLTLSPGVFFREAGEPLFAIRFEHQNMVSTAAGVGADPALPDWHAVSVDAPGHGRAMAIAETHGEPASRFERQVEVIAPELILLVDDLASAKPVRWQWRLELPARPVLATHARRCDLMGDGAGVRFYWLVPEGIRARLSDGERACTLTLETTQSTREVRIAVAVLPWVGEPPLPQRYRDGDRLGLRLDTPSGRVTASCSESGDR